MIDENDARLQKLRRDLRIMREKRIMLDRDIAAYERVLKRFTQKAKARRPKRKWPEGRPPCGTEYGYQWHRKQRDNWPLPKDDPCGCRRAHADHWHTQKRAKQARAQPEQEVALSGLVQGGRHARDAHQSSDGGQRRDGPVGPRRLLVHAAAHGRLRADPHGAHVRYCDGGSTPL